MKSRRMFLVMMLAVSLMTAFVSAGDFEPQAGPNYLGFTPSSQHVTIGDTLYTVVWADIDAGSPIDTAALDNFSFTPAGILNYTNVVQGNLFSGGFFFDPGSWGTISNESGYATTLVWVSPTNVSDVNRTFANISWLAAGCGVATINVSAGGTALGGIDPGTTFYEGEVTVHTGAPGGFAATPYNTTQINLTWTTTPPVDDEGIDTVVVFANSSGYPYVQDPGDEIYNGTGTSYAHSGLNPGEHWYYTFWSWNETAALYSLLFQIADGVTNNPPAFGTPSPTNGSVGQEIALTWSIPITDAEGETFNWTIECSNGQSNSANGASNGTKSLSISGLLYSTWYVVYVNATDLGSGTWTRAWYNFQTKANTAPEVPNGTTDIDPYNNETNVPIGYGSLQVDVVDMDDHMMNVTFYWGNGTVIGTDTNVTNGSTASVSIPILNVSTNYTWYVNITDAYGLTTRGPAAGNWTFTTASTAGESGPGDHGIPSRYGVAFLVTGSPSLLPLGGAVITIYEGQELIETGVTATDGIFETTLEAGTYSLLASKAGYAPKEQTLVVASTTGIATTQTVAITLTETGAFALVDASGALTTQGWTAIAAISLFLLIVLFVAWYYKKM